MQKWTGLLFALLLAAFLALVVVMGRGAPRGASSAADAGANVGDAAADADAAGAADAGAAPTDAGAGDAEADERGPDAGALLLNGEVPPPLPASAPKSVTFGVILVQYKGAQGALPTARSREAALELAKQLAAEAKQDFKAAVAKGDKGSMENAGRLGRGYLEPAPEYVLFSLAKDGVSDPVDTPRGFWIARRID